MKLTQLLIKHITERYPLACLHATSRHVRQSWEGSFGPRHVSNQPQNANSSRVVLLSFLSATLYHRTPCSACLGAEAMVLRKDVRGGLSMLCCSVGSQGYGLCPVARTFLCSETCFKPMHFHHLGSLTCSSVVRCQNQDPLHLLFVRITSRSSPSSPYPYTSHPPLMHSHVKSLNDCTLALTSGHASQCHLFHLNIVRTFAWNGWR